MTTPRDLAALATGHILETNQAHALGLVPVAGPYRPIETWMLARVLRDLQRDGVRCAVVRETARHNLGGWIGLSVWRQP